MARKMATEQERLDRIAKNYKKLPAKQAQNLKKSQRGAEIIRHATGTAGGAQAAAHRPQDRVRKG